MTDATKSIWLRGLLAAAISGASGGIANGLALVGISPEHFNFVAPGLLIKAALAAAIISALLGVAAYLQKSPLPGG